MSTTANTGKPSRFAREYDMIVSSYRHHLGWGGMRERALCGLYRDEHGRRRRVELCRLGAAASLDSAIQVALGAIEHLAHDRAAVRRYERWLERLRATERAALAADRRYRERVRTYCAGLPEHAPELVAAE